MILVSGCNRFTPGLFKLEDNRLHRINKIESRGICQYGDRIYVASSIRTEDVGIHVFDLDLNHLHHHKMDCDIHALCLVDKHIVAVDSVKDRLLYFTPGMQLAKEESAKIHTKVTDRQHYNDIFYKDGVMYYCSFGRFGEGAEGFIAMGNQILYTGLRQPHSVFVDGEDNVWYCNSKVHTIELNGKTWLTLNGYTRGLYVTPSTVYAGVSENRKKDGSVRAGVMLIDRKTKEQRFVSMDNQEVYQIREISK